MKKFIFIIIGILSLSLNANVAITVETDSFFSDKDCNKNIHFEFVKDQVNVCSTFNFKVIEEEKKYIRYNLISKPKGFQDWNSTNIEHEIIIDSDSLFKETVFELDIDLYDYAIQGCYNNYLCELINMNQKHCNEYPEESCEIEYSITFNTDNLPNICN